MENLKISYAGIAHVTGLKTKSPKRMVSHVVSTDGKHLRKKENKNTQTAELNIVEFHTDSNSSEDTNQPRKGRLSSRMLIPGNTWQNVWNTAKPVPARRQVVFFN